MHIKSSGQKLKPLVILKRKTIPPKDMVVQANEKEWLCESIILAKRVFSKMKKRIFSATCHPDSQLMGSLLLDPIKAECKMSTTLAAIPGGLAKVLQLLDLIVNKAFKSEIRKLWEDWMRSRMYSFTS